MKLKTGDIVKIKDTNKEEYSIDNVTFVNIGNKIKMTVYWVDGELHHSENLELMKPNKEKSNEEKIIKLIKSDGRHETIEVKGKDFSSEIFNNNILKKFNFIDCDFIGCHFDGTDFHDCNFENCNFEGALFHNNAIVRCQMEGNDFSECNFNKIYVNQSNLSGSNFKSAHFLACSLSISDMSNCDFSLAGFSEGIIQEVILKNSIFKGVKMITTMINKCIGFNVLIKSGEEPIYFLFNIDDLMILDYTLNFWGTVYEYAKHCSECNINMEAEIDYMRTSYLSFIHRPKHKEQEKEIFRKINNKSNN